MSGSRQHHQHDHEHDHQLPRHRSEKKLRITVFAQLIFVILQIIGAVLTGSQAVLANALHTFSDGVAIFIAWIGELLSHTKKKHTARERQYFSNLSAVIVAALIISTAVSVIINCIVVLLGGDGLLGDVVDLSVGGMIALSSLSIVYSLVFAFWLQRGRSHNEKTLSIHLFMDVGNGFLIILGAIIIHYTNFFRIDAILGIIYMVVVIVATIKRMTTIIKDMQGKNQLKKHGKI